MNKMKRKSIISMLLLSMMLGMFSVSCQDMLTPNSERHSYTVAEDTLYSYWGILKSLQNIAERYVILNECRGDLVDASSFISDTIGAIVNFGEVDDPEDWKDGACAYLKIADYYHIINSCNAYIAMCDTMRTTGTNKSYMIKEYAQVHSIRAWVYMQLLYAYGENKVPFYKEPMLTTDDINNFVSNKNCPKVTAQLLADELGPELEQMEVYELDPEYGMLEYNNYGDVSSSSGHFVCHSSKCLFPIPIVLGDLYLLSGRYADAAQHYYNYINTEKCGPLSSEKYYCEGALDDRRDYPIYDYNEVPYTERGAVSRSGEMITCIPSNVGKLEGKVMTDINRLFGFTAEMTTGLHTTISVKDDGDIEQTSDIASMVILTRNYERELIPSRGYEALCDSQKYEVYVGEVDASSNRPKWELGSTTLEVLPEVGDARRAWIYSGNGQQFTFRVGDDNLYGKMVSKQNPGQGFITTYPVIYRKSYVWLRYAEALNRAGYPSYAFAILKTGLCNNREWFPVDPDKATMTSSGEYIPATDYSFAYFTSGGEVDDNAQFDYPITDSLFAYIDVENSKILPEGWMTDNKMKTYAELEAWLTDYFQAEYDAWLAAHPDGGSDDAGSEGGEDGDDGEDTDPIMEGPRTIDKGNVYWRIGSASAIGNQPYRDCGKACYYIDRRELLRAANTPYLNFQQPYLRGQDGTQLIWFKDRSKLLVNSKVQDRVAGVYSDDRYTIGIHQRGCGLIRYDEEYGNSTYNYVTMVQKKVKEATGKDLSADDIYSGNFDADVQDAVEDLIIDESGLELAFEGTRFSDLCRVALRRGNNDYLAERVAKRHTGKVDEKLRSRLQDKNNWFLPIPEY